MILNLTQHAATPEQSAQGLVDYTNRESLKWLLTIEEHVLADFNWVLEDVLDGRVEDLVTIASAYQAEADVISNALPSRPSLISLLPLGSN
jgi:hypothetical protein